MYVKYRVLLNKETWESESMADQLTIAIPLFFCLKNGDDDDDVTI